MYDLYLLFVFVLVSITCFVVYLKSINEQKKWINLYAKKFNKETYEESIKNLQRNPVLSPFYSIKLSAHWFYMLFKGTDDQDLNLQAKKVKAYFYLIGILVISLITFLATYALLVVRS